MNFKKIVLIASCAAALPVAAQDVHFSQFNETPQLLNPGATGVYSGYVRAIVNYKNQWQAMGNAFNTVAASVDMPLFDKNEKKAHIGAGINFFSDKAGDSNFGTTQANLCLSAILPVSRESKFSVGMSFGGAQKKLNVAALSWGNQYNGQGFDNAMANGEPAMQSSLGYFDLGAGAYFEWSNGKTKFDRNEKRHLDVGVAYFHINQPAMKFMSVSEKLYGKIVANVVGHFDKTGTKVAFEPSAIFFQQGKAMEITAGCAVRVRLKNETKITGLITESSFAIGLHYRVGDAIIPAVYFQISDFAFGVSYDINISSYKEVSKYNGGAEISLKYNILKGALFKQKNMI